MADLTERQKQEYWRYNSRLATILLVIWFVVTYVISGLWADWLNHVQLPRASRSATTWRRKGRSRSSLSRSRSTPT